MFKGVGFNHFGILNKRIVITLGSLDLHFSSGGAAAPMNDKSTWVCCCLVGPRGVVSIER